MRTFVGVTDYNWFRFLSAAQPDEVNFWQPKTKFHFHKLNPGELFLFKLKAPRNAIAGGGWFVRQAFLPASLAWDAFGQKNGRRSFDEFLTAIYGLRGTDRLREPDPIISSLILTEPFFLPESQWIPVPSNWAPNLVQGRGYDAAQAEGRQLLDAVNERLRYATQLREQAPTDQPRYGEAQLTYPRLGQGAFRVVVTEAYHRRCAISNERTLPVLSASHIRPYAKDGPHLPSNGLLLRQDIHTLFDRGYITVNEDYVIEVSNRIKDDYGNGKAYYAYRGLLLPNLPDSPSDRPSRGFLRWHNEHVYVG